MGGDDGAQDRHRDRRDPRLVPCVDTSPLDAVDEMWCVSKKSMFYYELRAAMQASEQEAGDLNEAHDAMSCARVHLRRARSCSMHQSLLARDKVLSDSAQCVSSRIRLDRRSYNMPFVIMSCHCLDVIPDNANKHSRLQQQYGWSSTCLL